MPTAYVFSRHPAEPPTHLVGKTIGNARVAAAAKLEGDQYGAFTKLEYEGKLSLSAPTGDDPVSDVLNDAKVIFGCDTPDCHDLVAKVTSKIAVIGRDHRYLCFIEGKANGRLDHLESHEAELGTSRIAAGTDGQGSVVVELAGNDEAELRERAAAISDHPSISNASVHLSRSIVRAD